MRQHRKSEKEVVSGKQAKPPLKQTKNSLGPVGLVFLTIFQTFP